MLFRIQIKLVTFFCLLICFVFPGCEKDDFEHPGLNENQTADKSNTTGDLDNKCAPMHGSALYFDGIDDYVVVPHDPSLDMTYEFTITAWVKLEAFTEWASIVTKGGLPESHSIENNNNYAIQQGGPTAGMGSEYGRFCLTHDCVIFSIPLPQTITPVALNEWHHVAVVFDDTLASFYLDGRLNGQYPVWGPLCTNEEPLNIGADFPGGHEYWHGLIDEIKIWNIPLSKHHIWATMHGNATPMARALVAYWSFDEGYGTIAHDRSRFRNHGELIGGPVWVRPGAPQRGR